MGVEKENIDISDGGQFSYGRSIRYFLQFDGLRCFAVMSVMFSHFVTSSFVALIPLGSMGVNLFFVLSGFLITRILLLSKENNKTGNMYLPIKRFYIRRTLRIFPIYYLTVIFLFVINFPAVRDNIGWLISYTFNIKFSLPHVWETNQLKYLVHLWSLSVEEQFYILFPFLIFFIQTNKLKSFIIIMGLLGILSRLTLFLIKAPLNSIYVFTPCCFDAFAAGALLAYCLLYEPYNLAKIINNRYLIWIAMCIYIIDIIYSRLYISGYGECRTVLERFLFSILCFWIVGKAIFNSYSGYLKKIIENKFVVYIGKISYGLYIYHYLADVFFYTIAHRISERYYLFIQNNILLRAVVLFVGTIAFATLSWYIIERPLNNLKEKINYKIA